MIIVNFLNNIVETTLHIFSDIQFLLVYRLKLNNSVFILKTKEERIVDKIELCFFIQDQFVLLDRIDSLHNDFIVEVADGESNLIFVTEI